MEQLRPDSGMLAGILLLNRQASTAVARTRFRRAKGYLLYYDHNDCCRAAAQKLRRCDVELLTRTIPRASAEPLPLQPRMESCEELGPPRVVCRYTISDGCYIPLIS